MPGRYASKTGRGGSACGHIPASLNGLFADTLTQQRVCVVEILEKVGEEGVTVRSDSFLDSLEYTAIRVIIEQFRESTRNPSPDWRESPA